MKLLVKFLYYSFIVDGVKVKMLGSEGLLQGRVAVSFPNSSVFGYARGDVFSTNAMKALCASVGYK